MARGGYDGRFADPSAGDVVDAYGRPLDAYGRPLDAYGRPLDEYGRPLDEYGRPVDEYGRPVDEYGRPVDEYGRPVDDNGRPLDAGGDVGDAGDDDAAWEPEPVAARRRRRGLHLGPLAITPTRVTLLVAMIGTMAFLAYAVTVRDTSQIPMLASGSAVLGIVFAALALSGARGAVRAGSDGAGGRALAMALGGGIASVIAFGCFGAAIVLALVWRP